MISSPSPENMSNCALIRLSSSGNLARPSAESRASKRATAFRKCESLNTICISSGLTTKLPVALAMRLALEVVGSLSSSPWPRSPSTPFVTVHSFAINLCSGMSEVFA